jgi:hypothetical protein
VAPELERRRTALAADSWGDVASIITLAEALHGRGVNARVAAYSGFGDRVRAAGYEFVDLGMTAAGDRTGGAEENEPVTAQQGLSRDRNHPNRVTTSHLTSS